MKSEYRVTKTRIEGYKEETFQPYFRFVNKWSRRILVKNGNNISVVAIRPQILVPT